ncbi:MAG: AMP-binding protein [Acidobacteria bacterium]|nr:AMP-binding protein [Acidobacteriota bacterium]MCI0626597.1 AMP-binding protein [Acidobacteriota bacterium]MCI0719428.1 AMP-binding protein [Acidobacteriota bacterium]
MQDSRNTLLRYFQRHFSHNGETAYVDRCGLRTVRWSYQQIGELAARWAAELAARKIMKGDRVLLWAENSAHWVAAFYGCLLRGAVVVPLDARSEPGFAARVQQQVEAKILLAGTILDSQGLFGDLPALSIDTAPPASWTADAVPAENLRPDDLVEIIFTSGTTAEPRGVCLTHRNLLANLVPLEKEIQKYLRWERLFHPVRFMNLVPLSHVFGQFMGVFVPQLLRGEVHFQNSLNPGEVIETVKGRRISVVVTVPRFLDSLKEKLEREVGPEVATKGAEEDATESGVQNGGTRAPERVSSPEESKRAQERPLYPERVQVAHAGRHFQLHPPEEESFLRRVWRWRHVHRKFGWKFWAFVSGGATLPASTEAFWNGLGFALVQGYGMTETAALVSVAHPFKPKKRSIGRALPGTEVRVAADGEILVRGDNISPGFWSGGVKPLTDAEGWLHTGDLAQPDEGDHLYFQGRKKDLIVTAAGVNIHPEDLETALNRQPEVRASAVVGVDGRQGPEPVAILLLKHPSGNASEPVEKANRELAQHQQIRRWLIWPEPDFPRTPTQKVRKPALTAWARSQVSGVEAAGSSQDGKEGAAALAVLIGKVTGEVPARTDRSLRLDADLKLDSLGRVELLSLLEDYYQIELDEAEITSALTLGDLEDRLHVRWSEDVRRDIVDEPASGRLENSKREPSEEAIPLDAGDPVHVSEQSPYPYPRWPLNSVVRWIRVMLFESLILPLARMLSRIEVSGIERLEALNEPALFVSNHVTYADPGVILAALPRKHRIRVAIAMDGERLRGWRHPVADTGFARQAGLKSFYYLAVLALNVFPLPQRSGFRRSFAFAGQVMDRGYHLLVFPEGRLTADGAVQPFRKGIGLLAAGLRAPVVPVKLDGLFELRQRRRRTLWAFVLRPGRVSVTIGNPLRFGVNEDPEVVTRKLEAAIGSLGRITNVID